MSNIRQSRPHKIVLANGCFDPFHVGHLKHFQAAKKLGDELVVSVTRDKYVNKGPNRPAFDEKDRASVIAALGIVDRVILVKSSREALERIRPDIFVKGREYEGKILEEDQTYCASQGIEIVFTDEPVHSSTKILNDRLLESQ